MAKSKAKEAKVPLKGEKKKTVPKASETARVKPSNLSEEVVLESGSESDSGNSGGGSDTESEDEKRKDTKKADVKKVAATEPSEPPVPDDTSSEDEDDDEEEEEEEEEEDSGDEEAESAKPASKKSSKPAPLVNGVKRKADESSSAESGESGDELPDAPVAKKARSESEESEENSGKINGAEKMDVDKPALPPGVIASSIPAQPFEPPPGYTPVDTNSRSALTSSDLEGKQIWHIIAPANVPISSLTEVAFDAIQSGKPVLSHNGLEYMLSENKHQQGAGTAVLLPGKEGYTPIQQPIVRTLHLRQHIVLPDLSEKQADHMTGSNTAGDVATAAVAAVRPQPRGLRMRYRPPGFGAGDPGKIGSGSDIEEEPVGAEAVFQFPKKPEVSGKKEKKDKKGKKDKKSKKDP